MDLNYEEIFKISLIATRFTRSDPAIKRNVKWMLQFFIIQSLYTIVFLIIMYNIIFINLKDNNFSQTCKNGTLSVVYIVISFMYTIMLWKQQHLENLIDNIKKDYDLAKLLPVKEQEIMEEFAKKGGHIGKQWMIITGLGTCLFPLKNIVLISFHWIKGEFRLIPVYELVIPYFLKDKDSVAVFCVVYIMILGFGFYSTFMYTAFVPLGPSFMLHACGQLEILKMRIDVLFNSDDVNEVAEKLKDIVKQSQYIYDFVGRINLCFRVAYEMTLKMTMIILPITCYEVLESFKHGEISLEFLMFIIGGVLICGFPCFYSDLLMEKGEEVRLAMYSCGWEKVYDRSIRSTIKVVLQRALQPIAVRTLFRIVCLDALTDVFHHAYAIFNLMDAVWK